MFKVCNSKAAKTKKSVFCIYVRHLSIMLLAFVTFCIICIISLKYLMTPFFYEEVYKSVYSSLKNKESYLIMLILSNATEELEKVVMDDSFLGEANSKKLIPFLVDEYKAYGLRSNCGGSFQELGWANVCKDKEEILFEIPIISADNTLAHLLIDINKSISKWAPYRVVRNGLLLMVVLTVLLYVVLIIRFYEHFAKPIKNAMAMLARTMNDSKRCQISEVMPICELYELTRGIEQNAHFAAIGQISSHIAHDMRSPLSVLETYIKNENSINDFEEKEFRSAAARSVKKLLHMADDLVDYAKATKVERSVINLKKLLGDSVISEARNNLSGNNIGVRCEIDENIYTDVDAYKMGRVLVNLVNNSMQAISHDHGEIAISTKVEDSTLVIEVVDNGKGVAKEHLPRVFDSFYTAGKAKGTGLGLSYCKQVVEAHGGTIDVQSEVGKGTTFKIRIPNCVVDSPIGKTISKTHNMVFAGKCFSVIDDDADIRLQWHKIIEENGGKVLWEVASGEEAVRKNAADYHGVDTAIVDYSFPRSNMTGVDVIKHLRSKGIKEIHLCTGFADDPEIRSSALAAGATSVIGKG